MTNNKEAKVNLENQTATVLAQAVAEELGEIPEVSITIEELKALERADRKKRNRKKVKVVGIAAALLLVCGVAAYAALPDNLITPVDADKNTSQSVQEESGIVIIDEGSAKGEGTATDIEKNWEKVVNKRKEFPDLMIPTYVPDGYEFVQLEIEEYASVGYQATYKYRKGTLELRIEEKRYEEGENAQTLTKTDNILNTQWGKGYILDGNDDKIFMAGVHWNNKTLNVCGTIDKAECIKIINNIDMP